MGPITLFDKSFLEMLSVDQAALFDSLYSANICPVFLTEALADLSKTPPGNRTVEKIVSDLAMKSPPMHCYPNAEHTSLCLAELFGHPIEMRGVPAMTSGKLVQHEGQLGVVYDDQEELAALLRWQKRKFYDLERKHARRWRDAMKGVDHRLLAELTRSALGINERPKTMADAYAIAGLAVDGSTSQGPQLRVALALLGLDVNLFPAVHKRWVDAGRPKLREFAPYTAYCLHVELFFHVCIEKMLISPDRASNRVDIAYLFYLPFCQVFVSNDKLHRAAAPHFLTTRQQFIFGQDLKADLGRLDDYFSAMPEADREDGLIRLVGGPPDDDSFLTTRVWKAAGFRSRPKLDPSKLGDSAPILAKVRAMQKAKPVEGGQDGRMPSKDELEHVAIKRLVPRRMGKWALLPPGVKGISEEDEDDE